jgi:molecular chaperone GrpE
MMQRMKTKMSKKNENEEIKNTPETETENPETENAAEETKTEEKSPIEAELEKSKADLEAAQKELAEYKDKYLRLMAEYDNFRKRSVKEKADIYPEATAKAVEAFLPMADNFERALNTETTDEKYKSGVKMIYSQLGEAFKSLGVEVIDRVGETFDPNLENAVSRIEDENLGENVVAQVFQKGYKRGDKVIRHAMVIVANV